MAKHKSHKQSNRTATPAMDHDYQAEDDHRTMVRAAEIHGDSARMAGVRRHQTKQVKALSKVDGMLGAHRSMSRGR